MDCPDGRAGQGGPKHRQVFHPRNHFFDSGDGDVNARKAGAEAAIALVRGESDHAGIGDQKIRAGDAHFGGEKSLPQSAPGGGDKMLRVVALDAAELFLKKVGDFGAREVHRGRHEVIGRLVAQLHDQFAKVRLENLHALLFERVRQIDFLGDHRFRFHHGANTAPRGEVGDVLAGILGSFRPEDMPAALFYARLEFQQVVVEVVDGFPFDFMAALPRRLPIDEARAGALDGGFIVIDPRADGAAMHKVGGL